ncbi:MAG: cation/H(+) antiporter [Candidatus Rokuibacteriota bacterium]|nr:MAG: cation/H(+) antiporter [Candidatus Rokubacteria bacterium]
MTAPQLSVAFFLQMFFILVVCRSVAALVRRFGQPQVVGEMIAGVLMGPSLIGLLLPAFQQQIFPNESLKMLFVGGQLGVGLYMFLVGVEFKAEVFRARVHSAVAVSVAGMLVPFALGAGLALWMVTIPGMFAERTTTSAAVLFMGAAMSITAFPVLARIIHDHGLTGTALGTLALSAGCIGDAAAWGVLAVVIASVGGGVVVAVKAIAGGVAFSVFMLTLGRRLLIRLGSATELAGRLTPALLTLVMTLFTLAAWITDAIGLHAVFGAFLLGVAMPRGVLTRELKRQLEPFAVVFLLPMFFTFSGLNTRLDMVDDLPLLLVAIAVLVAACLGKGVACWAAARLNGESNRIALAVGALMNARGLMELIVLAIGLQHEIIGPALFSVMVLMTIVTTLLASPLFEWVYGRHARAAGELGVVAMSADEPATSPERGRRGAAPNERGARA